MPVCHYPFETRVRFVTLSVVRGSGLAAKGVSGFPRTRAAFGTYDEIDFKKRSLYNSPQMLQPEWLSFTFAPGWITEVESDAIDYPDFGLCLAEKRRLHECDESPVLFLIQSEAEKHWILVGSLQRRA